MSFAVLYSWEALHTDPSTMENSPEKLSLTSTRTPGSQNRNCAQPIKIWMPGMVLNSVPTNGNQERILNTAFPITHNCGSITHRFQFRRTDLRLVRHVGTHIIIFSDGNDRQRFLTRIHVRKADWFKCLLRKFYSDGDWLKIHVLFPGICTVWVSLLAWLKGCGHEHDLAIWWKYYRSQRQRINCSTGEIVSILERAPPPPFPRS